jgi:hypothetical protein
MLVAMLISVNQIIQWIIIRRGFSGRTVDSSGMELRIEAFWTGSGQIVSEVTC